MLYIYDIYGSPKQIENTNENLLLYHFDDYLLFYLFRGFNTSKRTNVMIWFASL